TYTDIIDKTYFVPFFLPVQVGNQPSADKIMDRLFGQYSISNHFVPLTEAANNVQNNNGIKYLEPYDEYHQTKELFNRLFLNLLNEERVAITRDWIMVFKGPMQLAMFMLFFVAIYLKFLPPSFLNKSTNVKEIVKRRLDVFDFCEETLPIFGFIGTIMGLMSALGDAYKIPVATGSTNSALAISSITTTLSVAFTTTLMAFTLKVILDLIKIALARRSHLNNNGEAV
ncbi:MAG: MotA/TolQ/ExbB proton channel family protein, partial [Bacteroidota bacterium]